MIKTVKEIRSLIKFGNLDKVRLSDKEVRLFVNSKPENRRPSAKLALIDAGLVPADAPVLEVFPKGW